MDQSYKTQHADARFALNDEGCDGIHVDRSSRIMTAASHTSFLDTSKMLLRAQQLADDTIGSADEGYRAACDRGYRDGLDQARGAATQENVSRSLAVRASLAEIEQDIAALVLHTLQRMLGGMDTTGQVALLVRQSLEQLGELRGEITIRCHPAHVAEVTERTQRWSVDYPLANLTALSDFDMAIDTCHVSCSSGRVVASLTQQLTAIEAALASGVKDV